ncbi:helix-turn-helix domain-containing protein [Christensenellaceae bacterium OttesenSCG-928-K19]|nr:helix-turn-helix domain-containing protein [Christensenellaceae bacterium OttesenSCG-928-K19]
MANEKNDVFENFELGKALISSLEEAVAFTKGDKTKGRVRVYEIPTPEYKAKDVKRIREDLHMSQAGLALALGVSKRTVEAWETGKNMPSNSSNKLLYLVEKDKGIIDKLVSVR